VTRFPTFTLQSRLVLLFIVLAIPLLAITRKVRIYNEQTGVKLEIAFKFKWNSTHGQIVGKALGGKPLDGEYSIGGGAVGWGQIYSAGKTSTVTTMSAGDRRGSLFATDGSGFVIHCEFVTNASTTHGSGACSDNQSDLYQLLF
jgi:hypothetical protein